LSELDAISICIVRLNPEGTSKEISEMDTVNRITYQTKNEPAEELTTEQQLSVDREMDDITCQYNNCFPVKLENSKVSQ